MGRTLPSAIQRIVLLALAPAPIVGCGGTTSAIDAGAPLDASTNGECAAGAHDGAIGGACAPHWIQGDDCNGGEVLFPCGLPTPPVTDSGTTSFELCATYCIGSNNFNGCLVLTDGAYTGPAFYADAGGGPTVVNCYVNQTGRRPAMLVDEAPCRARTIGEVLAHAAYLEASSVVAFLDLAAQLEAHGARRTLVHRLRRAAQDEVRHARCMAALARARGCAPPEVHVAETGVRSLLALALENAREGCVRETWGAACAVVQSMRATDLELRGAMRAIARDELRHAALSWDLARWIASRMTEEERARVGQERGRVVACVEGELERTPPEALRKALGLPTRNEARAIFRGMRADVWTAAA